MGKAIQVCNFTTAPAVADQNRNAMPSNTLAGLWRTHPTDYEMALRGGLVLEASNISAALTRGLRWEHERCLGLISAWSSMLGRRIRLQLASRRNTQVHTSPLALKLNSMLLPLSDEPAEVFREIASATGENDDDIKALLIAIISLLKKQSGKALDPIGWILPEIAEGRNNYTALFWDDFLNPVLQEEAMEETMTPKTNRTERTEEYKTLLEVLAQVDKHEKNVLSDISSFRPALRVQLPNGTAER